MEQLKKLLESYDHIAIDTSPFIYYIEENEQYVRAADILFDLIATGRLTAVTSIVTLIEVFIQPLKLGDKELEQKYRKLLLYSGNLNVAVVDIEIAEETARLRAKYKIRTPDAIQLATALVKDAEAFITNDSQLGRIQEIPVVVLKDYV